MPPTHAFMTLVITVLFLPLLEIPARANPEGLSQNSSNPSRLENLNPSPNPLNFPTERQEVEVQETQAITLREATALAIRNNQDLQQTRLRLQRAEAALREARTANSPNVNATSSLTRSGQESAIASASSATEFDRRWGDSLGLNGQLEITYDLYTSGRRSASIRSAAGQFRSQELQLEIDTEQLRLEVATAYYDLQERTELIRIRQDTLAQARQSLGDAEALERAGVGTRYDVLQARVDLANAQQNLRNEESNLEIARHQLVETLNLGQTVEVTPAEPIAQVQPWNLTLEDSILRAYQNRAELEQSLVQREISAQQRRIALSQLRPQLSVRGAYGLSNDLDSDVDESDRGVGFLSNYSIALNVSMSLYDGGAARAQADQDEKDIEIAEAEFASNRDQIRFNVQQAYSQFQANQENVQTALVAVEEAQASLQLARLRFQAGVGTQSDVLQSVTDLTTAEVNRLSAILDYNRAIVNLRRNVGR
jgi:outer membrane protein TolC